MFTEINYPIGIKPKRGLSGFGDFGRVASDPALITALYTTVLGRQPDSGGFTFWNNAYMESGNRVWLLAAFITAAEANGERILSRTLPQAGINTPITKAETEFIKANSEIVQYDPSTGQIISTQAGFNLSSLGSSWPILAIVGVGAFLIFRGGAKGKGKKSRRR